MKSFLFAICLFYSASLLAQQLTKVPVYSPSMVPAQAFAVNDSLFVLAENSSEPKLYKYFWLVPDGYPVNVDMSELCYETILGVMNAGDSVFFYYPEKKKGKSFIKTVAQHRITGKKSTHSIQSMLQGDLLGAFRDKDLFFVTYENKTRKMYVSQIKGSAEVDLKIFQMPIDISYKDRSIGFIQEGVEVLASQSKASVKFYKNSDGILIGIDQFEPDVNLPRNRSLFMKLDFKTGQVESKWFNQPDQEKFRANRTFISGKYIYKVVDRKGFDIGIFDLNSFQQIKTIRIDEQNPISDSAGFMKNHYEKVFKRDRTIWDIETNKGNCFITPILDIQDSTIILKAGTFKRIQTRSVMPTGQFGLAILLISAAASLSTIHDVGSVEYYYYLRWNEKENTILYESHPTGLGARIDDYELRKGKAKYYYKGYVHGKGVSYGIYKNKKGNSLEIDIVKFESGQ